MPRLFYRVGTLKAGWQEINLALPQNGEPAWGVGYPESSLDTVNLDKRGAAEVIIRLRPYTAGSGGATSYDYVVVLDITASPRVIFRGLLAEEDEAFAGYAAMHGIKLGPGELDFGCKRSFRVRSRELLLGPTRAFGNQNRADCSLLALPAGRYRYGGGRVFRAGP